MAQLQNFRGAFNGFNREDVIHYIELLNNNHNAQVTQLNTELQTLRAQLEEAQAVPPLILPWWSSLPQQKLAAQSWKRRSSC